MNKIVTYVNLNHKRARCCVAELISKRLIQAETRSGVVVHTTTRKGVEWLSRYLGLKKDTTIF